MGEGRFEMGKWRWENLGGCLEKREEKHDVINSKQ
jgi:hypothetical protein